MTGKTAYVDPLASPFIRSTRRAAPTHGAARACVRACTVQRYRVVLSFESRSARIHVVDDEAGNYPPRTMSIEQDIHAGN
ncbi:hypothetical protein LGM65_13885 [Burkholderia anthina]|uniref:hypothetical protein n=1 Tax=Burkholderia anthina TaxID=179879 RepID=UPI001CF5D101|nr:hypothetical protein [Burkholderia anthina]MCA8091971.1 hypothetical protein [Burkholderia anthina]